MNERAVSDRRIIGHDQLYRNRESNWDPPVLLLLHHVIGGTDGKRGAWAFAIGGMGAVSEALASAAHEAGAEFYTNAVRVTVRFAFSEVAPSPNFSSLNANNRSVQVHYNGPWFWYFCRISQKSQVFCGIAQRYQSPSPSIEIR